MSLDDLSNQAEQSYPVRRHPPARAKTSAATALTAWITSLALHTAAAATVIALLSQTAFTPPVIEYAMGDQVVPNVGLLTAEDFDRLTRPQAPTPAPEPPATLESPSPVAPSNPIASPSPAPQALTASAIPISEPLAIDKSNTPPRTTDGPTLPPLAESEPAPVHKLDDTDLSADRETLDAAPHRPHQPELTGAPGSVGIATGVQVTARPLPNYPPASLRDREEGLVILNVEMKADGTIGTIEVLSDPGYPRLVQAAVEAARRLRFKPATENGRPIDLFTKLPYRFTARRR